MPGDRPFRGRVYAVVRLIPAGRVATYGYLALLAGWPRRARQVGQALRTLPRHLAWGVAEGEDDTPLDRLVPWHRVVNAQGRVSPRSDTGTVAFQVALLRAEGVEVTDDGLLLAGLDAIGWWPDPGDVAAAIDVDRWPGD